MIPKSALKIFTLFLMAMGYAMAQVSVPDTPAGRTLQAWLEAFNSGDRAKIERYVNTIDHTQSVDGLLSFRNGTGGFDLLAIESSDPLHIRFRSARAGIGNGPEDGAGVLVHGLTKVHGDGEQQDEEKEVDAKE